MKAFTSIEQSKKLAEILPLESADMWWNFYSVTTDNTTPQIIHIDTPWVGSFNWNNEPDNIPCWSLTALLSVLPEEISLNSFKDGNWNAMVQQHDGRMIYEDKDNPVDACYEMIINLYELNLL